MRPPRSDIKFGPPGLGRTDPQAATAATRFQQYRLDADMSDLYSEASMASGLGPVVAPCATDCSSAPRFCTPIAQRCLEVGG